MNDLICGAIRSRSVIAFDYDHSRRIVEPHCHGISVSGKELIRGYQIGEVIPADGHLWRLFDVSKMLNLTVLPEHFVAPRAGYNPADEKIARIHCNL